MTSYRLLPVARDDLDEIREYIARDSPGCGGASGR